MRHRAAAKWLSPRGEVVVGSMLSDTWLALLPHLVKNGAVGGYVQFPLKMTLIWLPEIPWPLQPICFTRGQTGTLTGSLIFDFHHFKTGCPPPPAKIGKVLLRSSLLVRQEFSNTYAPVIYIFLPFAYIGLHVFLYLFVTQKWRHPAITSGLRPSTQVMSISSLLTLGR